MPEQPTGTVTFLFTDLEGSTHLWEEYPEAMHDALARHDAILRDAVATHDGHLVKTTGDGIHAAFGFGWVCTPARPRFVTATTTAGR
jgi:class 3 adenylate cyclase